MPWYVPIIRRALRSRLEDVMRNGDRWMPSKYVYRNGRLVATRDPNQLKPSSRLMADAIAALYEKHLPTYARGRLIDLGCGMVPLFATYRHYVSETICVDWASAGQKNDYLDYECDLSSTLPFADS